MVPGLPDFFKCFNNTSNIVVFNPQLRNVRPVPAQNRSYESSSVSQYTTFERSPEEGNSFNEASVTLEECLEMGLLTRSTICTLKCKYKCLIIMSTDSIYRNITLRTVT
jgi:hypothetical protein